MNVLKTVDHNRYTFIAGFLAIACQVVLLTACKPVVSDPRQPDNLVSRELLDISSEKTVADMEKRYSDLASEMTRLAAEYETAYLSLEQQEQRNRELLALLANVTVYADTATGLPISSLIAGLATALGFGISMDNRRKDKVIDTLKNKNA